MVSFRLGLYLGCLMLGIFKNGVYSIFRCKPQTPHLQASKAWSPHAGTVVYPLRRTTAPHATECNKHMRALLDVCESSRRGVHA